MPQSLTLSDAQWQLMHEVWSVPWITSGQLVERLREPTGWSPGTIKTMLHRLVDRGVLEFERCGQQYRYRATVSAAECRDCAQQRLLHTAYLGRPVPMLVGLVQSARLSGQELAELQSFLGQLQQQQPTQ